jgi:F-type H+-transporting ATPase subunit delta
MNAGLIASRYANALMRFAQEKQVEDRLYEEAGAIRRALGNDQQLTACIAAASEPMQKFLTLVIRNKRVEFLPEILRVFRVYYRKEKGITQALLTTAAEEPQLAGKLRTLMQAQGFTQVDFKTEVDPGLIGGFILQVEDKRLDASIATQLRTIRKEWEEQNRKIRNNG